MVADEYGGRFPAVDSLAVTVVREALAAESAHLDSLFAMQGIGSYAVSVGGGDAVRKRWLPAVGRLEAIAALALTEPGVGSDLRSITTTVDRRRRRARRHRAQVVHHQRRRRRLLQRPRRERGRRLLAGPRPGRRRRGQRHPPAPDHRPARARRRGVRRRPGAGRPPARRARQGLQPHARDPGHVPRLGRRGGRRAGRGGPARGGPPRGRRASSSAYRWPGSASVPAALASSWTDIEMARALVYRAAAAATRDPAARCTSRRWPRSAATEAAGPRRRPLRAGDGPLRPGTRKQDRAALPGGPADAHLRGRDRGHLRLAGQAAREGTKRMIVDAHCHVWPDHIAARVLAARPVGLDARHDGTLDGLRRTMDAGRHRHGAHPGHRQRARARGQDQRVHRHGRPQPASSRSAPSTRDCPMRTTSSTCWTTASPGSSCTRSSRRCRSATRASSI